MNESIGRQKDRFSYSAGMTLSMGVKTYEFYKFDVGFSSDRLKDETYDDCVKRVVGKVEKVFNQKIEEFEKTQTKASAKVKTK